MAVDHPADSGRIIAYSAAAFFTTGFHIEMLTGQIRIEPRSVLFKFYINKI